MSKLRCPGCGRNRGVKLKPVRGWHADGRETLLCARCRDGLLISHDGQLFALKLRPADPPHPQALG